MSYWLTIKSLSLFFGPLLIPKVLAFYKKQRIAAAVAHDLHPRPLPAAAHNAITILLSITTFLLLRALFRPPENIFTATESRLQIPPDVLFNRFASLVRPLTAADEVLRAKFVSLESKLLYLKYGPRVLSECTYCTSERPLVYFLYTLPPILTPHFLNVFLLTLVMSPLLVGPYTVRWRSPSLIASVIFAIIDIYNVYTYPHKANAMALRLSELDMFYWRSLRTRYIVIGTLNLIVAILMYLTATNRAFADPPNPAMRVEATNKVVAGVLAKLNAVGILRNTVVRKKELREYANTYWSSEAQVTSELMMEDEVKDSMKDAVEERRVDVVSVTQSAKQYAETILGPWAELADKKEL